MRVKQPEIIFEDDAVIVCRKEAGVAVQTARAGQAAERMHRAYLEGCVGQVYPVLFEQAKDGLYTGHAPNYMEVGVAADGLHNVILDVKITGVDGEILRGELT